MSSYKTNHQLYERVARVEERVEGIKGELTEIKDNHLAHIQKDLNNLKIQVNTITVKITVAVAVAVIVIEVLARFLLR